MCIIVFRSDMTDPNHEHPINLLLVNETRLMGNVIAAALEGEADINVVACVTNVDEAMQIVREEEIGVVLVSTRLPDQGAIRLTRSITELRPSTRVLALGLTEEKRHVLRYVEAGATGYVLKDDSLEGLIETIRAAQDGKAIVSPKIAAAIMERLTTLARLFSDVESSVGETTELTSRELEVLTLVGKGQTNLQIAEKLVIEVGTVKNHRQRIYEKLDITTEREMFLQFFQYQPG